MKTKNIFLRLIPILCLSFFAGCSEDDKKPAVTGMDPSVLDNLPLSEIVIAVPLPKTNPLLLTVTWTETKFYLDGKVFPAGPVSYNLEADKAGNNFAHPVVLASSGELAANLYVNDVNALLLKNFEATPGDPVALELRLITSYGEPKPENTVTSSNKLALTLTPFDPPVDIVNIYLIGNITNPEWDNNGKDFILFRDDNDPIKQQYTLTTWFAADSYFKFCPEDGLGSWANMYCMGANGVLTFGDWDPFHIATEGYYTVTMDISAMTYSIATYDASAAGTYLTIGPVGEFCDWDNNPAMTQFYSHLWAINYTFDDGTTVKFRAENVWTVNWGAGASDLPYGKAYQDGAGCAVPAGTYRIVFNDLTGHYVIIPQ